MDKKMCPECGVRHDPGENTLCPTTHQDRDGCLARMVGEMRGEIECLRTDRDNCAEGERQMQDRLDRLVSANKELRAELAAMTERAKQAEFSISKMTAEFRAMESSWEAMQSKLAETERRQWDAEDALTAERERTKRRTEQLEICRREVLRLTRVVNERKDESK